MRVAVWARSGLGGGAAQTGPCKAFRSLIFSRWEYQALSRHWAAILALPEGDPLTSPTIRVSNSGMYDRLSGLEIELTSQISAELQVVSSGSHGAATAPQNRPCLWGWAGSPVPRLSLLRPEGRSYSVSYSSQ